VLADVLVHNNGQLTRDALGKDYGLVMAFTSVCRSVLGSVGQDKLMLNFAAGANAELPETWDGNSARRPSFRLHSRPPRPLVWSVLDISCSGDFGSDPDCNPCLPILRTGGEGGLWLAHSILGVRSLKNCCSF